MAEIVLIADPVTAENDERKTLDPKAEVVCLFDGLRTGLFRYLRWLGCAPDEADDAIQETFLRLHRHLLTGGARENLRAWVYRVAGNLARDERKTARRRRVEAMSGGAEPECAWIDAVPNPEQQVLAKEADRRLEMAIGSLPAVQRQCLALRSEGLRYREIAEVLGMGTSTVAEVLQRAVSRLARELP
jgi:RNA polymerase sigma-70 factor (ECF subfamily)